MTTKKKNIYIYISRRKTNTNSRKLNNIDDYYLSKVSYYFPDNGDEFLQEKTGPINNLKWPYKINSFDSN